MFNYRREIDGLRAVAVVSVILFHTGFSPFKGGFVGVDVFFVISGYLITSIILTHKEAGTFSLLNFYERRARRILPALFFIMAVCIPFAWLWLLPGDMKDFSKSLIAVSIFASNILFWRESDYFDAAAELKPLLHTWSLAVEEQYYVLFPIFLLVMWRFAKRWTAATLTAIAILSFAIAQWGAYNNQAAASFCCRPEAGRLQLVLSSRFILHATQSCN
jgi:peptidoglycan/LPS O-acetylase OafA/YrhL